MRPFLTIIEAHPWVTKRGTDPLISAEDNTANWIEPPTEEETNEAITGKFSNMLVIVYIPFPPKILIHAKYLCR